MKVIKGLCGEKTKQEIAQAASKCRPDGKDKLWKPSARSQSEGLTAWKPVRIHPGRLRPEP